jgi:DNA-binding NarL/FixJ family response regulator
MFIQALQSNLNSTGNVCCLGSATDPEDIPAVLKTEIELVLLDASTNTERALEMTSAISKQFPDVRIVALGLAAEEEMVPAFVEAGASGYTLRKSSVEQLITTLSDVYMGKTQCSDKVVTALFSRMRELAACPEALADNPDVQLTAREKQIIYLLGEYLSNKEIASLLGISIFTVKNHVHSVLTKLKCGRRQYAVLRDARNDSFPEKVSA